MIAFSVFQRLEKDDGRRSLRLGTKRDALQRLLPARVRFRRSVEESEDLSTNMLGASLVVVHDTLVGGQNDNTELTGGKDGVGEVLEFLEGEVETGRDDTALVETAVEVHNDLAIASVIDDLELIDVAVLLHDLEELDENLGGGAEDNLE